MSRSRSGSTHRVDTAHPVTFTFDGDSYAGCKGDTLASALMANGVRLLGRSFKYHRPRGILSAGIEEPNALVTILRDGVREPNLPATMVEIFDGMVAESQNRYPSVAIDFGAVNSLLAPLFSAGFYYKTFMGPAIGPLRGTKFWMLCEKFIRRAAGLGRASRHAGSARYEHMNAFCDVLIAGSGPAGLAAAKAAADGGKTVILCEIDPLTGGSANWSGEMIDGIPAPAWAAGLTGQLAEMKNVRILRRTTVWGAYDGSTYAAVENVCDHKPAPGPGEPRHRHWTIRTKNAVIATGSHERPLVFPGNDRPGIMLAAAGQRYAIEFGVIPGENVTVFTNNDSAYLAAYRLRQAGIPVAAIIDLRDRIGEDASALANEAGIPLYLGHSVARTSGRLALKSIEVSPLSPASGAPRKIATDCLLMSGGWTPVINLATQSGGKPVWNETLQVFLVEPETPGRAIAGSANGKMSTVECLGDGDRAGRAASGRRARAKPLALVIDAPELDPSPAPRIETGGKGKSFVDFQLDVTTADIRLAHQEGFRSVEHLKRYTTLGMATDQGKTSNLAGLAIMAETRGLPIPEVGTTRFRPPYAPVSIGALSGERSTEYKPKRFTPLHDWQIGNNAKMFAVGLWYRPETYAQPGETVHQAGIREARAVRKSVGTVDVSTLGKIAVQGPDAGRFLDHVYTNLFSTLPVGKARYGLMLREDGIVLDDGTTWRLGEDDFLMTTTTANAGKVMQHLEYCRDVFWPDLRVNLTSVTDQWAGLAIAGPKSRDVLSRCVSGTRVDNKTLPFMAIVHGKIAGVPVMICRLSFSGERAYEVYCGAGYAERVWEAVLKAGVPDGMVQYGLEALDILRIEKGHVTGAEIDGRTTARDLHLDWMLSKKKPFIGSALMDREGLVSETRHTLVGLISKDGRRFRGGSHVVENEQHTEPAISIGHVSSACYSPALEKFIGLALVENGNARIGSRAYVCDPLRGHHGPVEIVDSHMFDPEGERMHG